jgi:hypothetical protein
VRRRGLLVLGVCPQQRLDALGEWRGRRHRRCCRRAVAGPAVRAHWEELVAQPHQAAAADPFLVHALRLEQHEGGPERWQGRRRQCVMHAGIHV